MHMRQSARYSTTWVVGVFFGLLTCFSFQSAQGQIAFWQQYIGGQAFEYGRAFLYLPNETIVIAGETFSQEQLGADNHSDKSDVVVFKWTTQGTIIWQRTLGGSGYEYVKALIRTQDGGIVLIGSTNSSDGDIPKNLGGSDIWVCKLDDNGNTLWQQVLGGRNDDQGLALLEAPNGDILVAGESGSPNTAYARPHQGALDGWIARLAPNGNKLWEKHYGGSSNDKITGLHALEDGTILVVGVSDSEDGDIQQAYGKKDAWLFSIDAEGEMGWSKNFGGSDNDDILSSQLTPTGDLVLGGTTFSQDQYIPEHQGEGDCWLFKVNQAGSILWSRTFGGSRPDGINYVTITADSNYLACGLTRSKTGDGDVEMNQGYYDGWLIKLNQNGERLWSRTMGYDGKESFTQIIQLREGGFLAMGYATQARGAVFELPGHHGGGDIWLCNFDDPNQLGVKAFRTPPVLIGEVKDQNTNSPLEAHIFLTENETLDSLGSAEANETNGAFVLLMPAYGLLSINVLTPGYMFLGQEFLMDSIVGKTSVSQTFYLEPIKINSKLILKNTYFQSGDWTLLPASFAELERIVAFLNLNPRVTVEISGHTDNTGNKDQKAELSLKRAEAVKDYLVDKGIHPNRLRTVGIGLYRPIAPNTTPEGRKKNRRVEIKVITM